MDLDDGYTQHLDAAEAQSLRAVDRARRLRVVIGRLTGFLAVAKSPSARSDNLIFAYGEVPRALDLSIRVTRLMSRWFARSASTPLGWQRSSTAAIPRPPTSASSSCRPAGSTTQLPHVVVGKTVREAGRRGIAGRDITGAMLDEVALAETGQAWGLTDRNLDAVLDPGRSSIPGSAPAVPPLNRRGHDRAVPEIGTRS